MPSSAIALISIAVAVALFVIWGSLGRRSVHQLGAFLDRGALILDVRTPGEFRQLQVNGAINIPVDQVEGRLSELGPPGPIIVYCATGMRSRTTAKLLRSQGFDVLDVGALVNFPSDSLQRG